MQQQRENDAKGLNFVHAFGWMRTPELGLLMWPHNTSSRQAADRLIRSWIKRKLVIERQLPERAGRIVVLSAAGVRRLAEQGIEASSGKDFGRTDRETSLWHPPSSWKHDLLAMGVLCKLYQQGYRVVTEAMIRRDTSSHQSKIPDGLVLEPTGQQRWLWLEVERARKTGPSMTDLAKALCAVHAYGLELMKGVRATGVMVAYNPESTNSNGHKVSHRTRIINAVQAQNKEVEIQFAVCTLQNYDVASIELDTIQVLASRAAAVLKRLNSSGWHQVDGGLEAHYGGYVASVWKSDEDDEKKWSFAVTGHGSTNLAGYDSSITAAKSSAAEMISDHEEKRSQIAKKSPPTTPIDLLPTETEEIDVKMPTTSNHDDNYTDGYVDTSEHPKKPTINLIGQLKNLFKKR